MKPEEFIQLKAFARIDGALLALFWLSSFIFYIQGLSNPIMGIVSFILAVSSPFYAATRLRIFRDNIRDGIISFRRAAAYYALMFFYASALFAIAQYIYFEFLDNGYLVNTYTQMLNGEEAQIILKNYDITQQQINDNLEVLRQTSPITFALNFMTINIMTGIVLSFPVGLIMKRDRAK
ncbi:DUF4199 domain-containing protein [Xylanibacter muris]|uniref:DUF4199 domain-containing protein n=1 Tax=Xylanibacter muris TaxID=2736290 RepID=A0ABX2AQ69_9BACT|nr:DUF4199 domain-containing protein [Xylanibacter muris]NPD92687.1 DUF4199 domain-containing protein [Xylanibacter muris]